MSLKEFLNLVYVTAISMTDWSTILAYGISFVLVYVWYKQKSLVDGRKYGYNANPHPFKTAFATTLEGYFGAIVCTFILITLGVVVQDKYIYPAIMLSMIFSAVLRSYIFLNIIYACAAMSFFASTANDVFSLMVTGIALIFVRGLLILISWTKDYIAFIVRNEKNEIYGGYSVKKIWPVYAGIIMFTHSTSGAGIDMPSWWPLFPPNIMKGIVLVAGGIMLFVSDSRNIYTTTKNYSILKSSFVYMAYGLVFIPLAWLFKANKLTSIGFALLALIVYIILEFGLRDNITSRYKIFSSKDKLTVLDVIPSSAAFYAKIKPLDKIVSINGEKNNDIESLNRVIKINRNLEIMIERGDKSISVNINIEIGDNARMSDLPGNLYELGIIAVPPDKKNEIVELSNTDMRG